MKQEIFFDYLHNNDVRKKCNYIRRKYKKNAYYFLFLDEFNIVIVKHRYLKNYYKIINLEDFIYGVNV